MGSTALVGGTLVGVGADAGTIFWRAGGLVATGSGVGLLLGVLVVLVGMATVAVLVPSAAPLVAAGDANMLAGPVLICVPCTSITL